MARKYTRKSTSKTKSSSQIIVADNDTVLRTSPTLNSEVVSAIPAGSQCAILDVQRGEETTFYKVLGPEGNTGYVCYEHLGNRNFHFK